MTAGGLAALAIMGFLGITDPAPQPVPVQSFPGDPTVQVIIIKNSGNVANIDGEIVRVGSAFMGGKVVAIESTHVEVDLDGMSWKLYTEGR